MTRSIWAGCYQATISAVVLDSSGKLVMESILETKAATILQSVHGLRGSVHISFEEGTCPAWRNALLQPHVTGVVVCDPRKSALLKSGSKNDRIDARHCLLASVQITSYNSHLGLLRPEHC